MVKARSQILRKWHFAALSLIVLAGLVTIFYSGRPQESPSEQLAHARRLYVRGRLSEALQIADQLIARNPDNGEIRRLAAEILLQRNQSAEAVAVLAPAFREPVHDPECVLLAAQIRHHRQYRLAEAETLYRDVLKSVPDHPVALEELAKLCAVCGRRREAIPLILKLVQAGKPTDLLFVLARESGSLRDPELLNRAVTADPRSALPLLGLGRMAESDGELSAAIDHYRAAVDREPNLTAARAELGRCLLEASRFDDLRDWTRELPTQSVTDPDIQRVLGFEALRKGHLRDAFGMFLRASREMPERKDLAFQLSQLLNAAGETEHAREFQATVIRIQQLYDAQDRVLFSGDNDRPQAYIELVHACAECGRFGEAVGWAITGLQRFPDDPQLRMLRDSARRQWGDKTHQLVTDAFNAARKIGDQQVEDCLAALEILMSRGGIAGSVTEHRGPEDREYQVPSFAAQTTEIGLDFEYENGESIASRKMYSYTGGGIGILDFDGDTWPDLALSQGGVWELRGTIQNACDRICRNLRGRRFHDCTFEAGIVNFDFGQGVACGDVNNDGFPDLAAASIGSLRLWINNGDGTFTESAGLEIAGMDQSTWLTSVAIADLNEDSLPDIYAAGYLGNQDVFSKVCVADDGIAEVCSPTSFDGVPDLLLLSDGAGSFRPPSDALPPSASTGKGLGVLVFDPVFSGHTPPCRTAIFVANDTTSNSLLVPTEERRWRDDGFVSGLAVSAFGKAEGSMGIASGDPNNDGQPDLLITNFLYEAHGWYRGLGDAAYRDDRAVSGIQNLSQSVLGFGTQFLDANLNGVEELFVANGHIDNLLHRGRPFRMPAQLFRFSGQQFQLCAPAMVGDYFQTDHLGRAVARCDWNGDGLPDLCIGHLEEPTVMLTNRSMVAAGSFCLKLVGTSGSRDAICTRVRLSDGDFVQHRQLTAGDGYHCSNEKLLMFAVSRNNNADLKVLWNSGVQQELEFPTTIAGGILIERRDQVYECPR